MIRNIQDKGQQWDKLLKYHLLVYRATPHTATGFSTYELVHSKGMRGPLEAVKAGWIGGNISYTSTVECAHALRGTLVALHKVAHANEEVEKDKSKTAYDVGSKAHSFEPGDLVLCHNPGLTGKLQSSGMARMKWLLNYLIATTLLQSKAKDLDIPLYISIV